MKKLQIDKQMHHKTSFWFTGTIWILSSVSSALAGLYGATNSFSGTLPAWTQMLCLSIIALGLFLGTMLKWVEGDD